MKSTIEFEHGVDTCAKEPSKFCQWERVSGFGTRFECILFSQELFIENGWLRRCSQCKNTFKGSGDDT